MHSSLKCATYTRDEVIYVGNFLFEDGMVKHAFKIQMHFRESVSRIIIFTTVSKMDGLRMMLSGFAELEVHYQSEKAKDREILFAESAKSYFAI